MRLCVASYLFLAWLSRYFSGLGAAWLGRTIQKRILFSAAMSFAALSLSACSMSMPMSSLVPDKTPKVAAQEQVVTTGSIAASTLSPKTAYFLAPELNDEDTRRAKAALALALDPVGSGAAVNWDNPDSQRKGNFIPVGQPFVKSDEICRAFLSNLSQTAVPQQKATSTLQAFMPSFNSSNAETTQAGATSSFQGTACRPSGGDWVLKDLQPWKRG